MTDDMRHGRDLVIPGLNFLGDQNDAAKSVIDKTKWVMQSAVDHIERLERALWRHACKCTTMCDGQCLHWHAKLALEGKDE